MSWTLERPKITNLPLSMTRAHTANVEKAHENGLKIIVWTINKPQEVEEYAKKGVDGIDSDKPDILMRASA